LNKLHVCEKIISCHKTPVRDGFIATTREYEAGLDKKINSGTPYFISAIYLQEPYFRKINFCFVPIRVKELLLFHR